MKRLKKAIYITGLVTFLLCQQICWAHDYDSLVLRGLAFGEGSRAGIDEELDEASGGTRYRRMPQRELTERSAEETAARALEYEITGCVGNLERIIAEHRSSHGSPQQSEITVDKLKAYVKELRSLYRKIPRDSGRHADYRERLEELRLRRDIVYERMVEASNRNNRDALKRLNLEAIGINRLITRYRIIAVGRILGGYTGHTNLVVGMHSALWALRGARNSARALAEELKYRTLRLSAARSRKGRQTQVVNWINEVVQTFGLKGFDIKVLPSTEPGQAPRVSIRQERWLDVPSSLREVKDNIRRGRINIALARIDLLSEIYRTRYDLTILTFRDIYERFKDFRRQVSALPDGQRPSPAAFNQISVSLGTIIRSTANTLRRNRVWVDISYRDLAAAFRSQLHTIEKSGVEIEKIQRNIADLEYYADLLNAAAQNNKISNKKRNLIIEGMESIIEWLEQGYVLEKQFALKELRAAKDLISAGRNDFWNAEVDLRTAIGQLSARIGESVDIKGSHGIPKIVSEVERRATALFAEYRDDDTRKRAADIVARVEAGDLDQALDEIVELQEFYFNAGGLTEPGYLRAGALLAEAKTAMEGAQAMEDAQQRAEAISNIMDMLEQAREDISHKYSFRFYVTMPDNSQRRIFSDPNLRIEGLLNILRVPAQQKSKIRTTLNDGASIGRYQKIGTDNARIVLALTAPSPAPQQTRGVNTSQVVLQAI